MPILTTAFLLALGAMVAIRYGFRSPCLAKAAHIAANLGYPKQKAYMDSIAVVLEGTSGNK